MSGIPHSSNELGPAAQRMLDFLSDRPNQEFTVEQLAQELNESTEEAKVNAEALTYQGEIEKVRPAGGETVYRRPRKT